MKYLFSLVLLTVSLGLFSQSTPYVNTRGCVVCDMLSVADTFSLNGATYTVVDRPLLNTMRNNYSDLSKVCVSLVSDMANVFRHNSSFNQDIGNWDVSNVSDMKLMFSDQLPSIKTSQTGVSSISRHNRLVSLEQRLDTIITPSGELAQTSLYQRMK